MIFETVVVGPLQVNCYILGCEKTGDAVVVDPGGNPERILPLVSRHKLKIIHIINTHGHFDHIGANGAMVEATGAELLMHEADLPLLSRASVTAAAFGLQAEDSPQPARFLTDGMIIPVGSLNIKVLHTPGHSPGGCCLHVEDTLITGDTLFADSVGRTDLPGGSMETLIKSIREKLLTLPEKTLVYPGHGPSSSIGGEKAHNPYLSKF